MRDVVDMYDLEKTKTLRQAYKLTEEHINPSSSRKMKVSLAAQLFSHTNSAAMESMKEQLSPTASSTANMLRMFNNLFDFLNSRSLTEVGTRRVALRQLWDEQQRQLHDWELYIKGLTFFPSHGRRVVKQSLPFKEGWLVTLHSVRRLISDCFMMNDIFFIKTRRLNQDVIEVSIPSHMHTALLQ